MLLSGGVRDVVPVAHPVAGHPHVDVPIALVCAAAFLVVLAVGMAVPPAAGPGRGPRANVAPSWEGTLRPAQLAVRALSVGLLLLAVVAARTGSENEVENIAPALLVGAGWPLLFLGTLLVGGLWRWLDPWDTLGRVAAPGDRSSPGEAVLPAVALGAMVLWYLGVHPRPLEPRTLGAAVAAYTVLTVAGCLVRGRRRWLSTGEPVGVVLNWLANARPRHPVEPPARGLPALLGVLAGGTLFAALRRTELWADLAGPEQSLLLATAGFLAACAAGVGLVLFQAWLTAVLSPARKVPGATAVALAVAPAVAGTVVAVAMARNRLTTSLQLLPGLIGDPFGRGWDLLGATTARLDPAPLGASGLLAAQLAVLVLTHTWGAVLVARVTDRVQRLPAVLLLGQLVAAAVAAVSLH